VRQRARRRAGLNVRSARGPSVDLRVYAAAVPVLLRNPTIIVVPLLMAVIAVLVSLVFGQPGGGVLGSVTGGLAQRLVLFLEMFGVGAACIIADDAWRHGRASFDRGWDEARRRGGDIFMAAIGFSLLLYIAQYAGALFWVLGIVATALVAFFLVWALPAAAIGGVPGSAAIQISIDRVRSNPLVAGITVAVSLLVMFLVGFLLPVRIVEWLPATSLTIAGTLIFALCQALALGYIATILTKTYTDASFGGRRW